MRLVNKESIISTLFEMGFESVDSVLYSYVLGAITLDNNNFKYSDELNCVFFDSVVVYDNELKAFKLKPGYTLDTNISLYPTSRLSVRSMLNINYELLDYLKELDFREIVFKKIQAYHFDLNKLSTHFCPKEKEIIADMFGIDDSVNIFKRAYELEFGDEIPDIPFMRMGESQKKHEIAKECLKESEKEMQNTAFDWYEPSVFEDDDKAVIKKRTK